VRQLVYLAVALLLAGCVPIGVRVQNMLAHAPAEMAVMPDPAVRSPMA
jgi:hypothetical protein